MADPKYLNVADVVNALTLGKIKRRTVSQLIQYYRKRGKEDKVKMFQEALKLTLSGTN
ncbi:hypothetical protein KLEP7_gp192 [Pseudaeromonas phage vB_PpeM_ KLEP7]|nr:hypothetical protein KLEP7_gp192 [Pseudaeromonas phage vB_PpeM_ KLEP7]